MSSRSIPDAATLADIFSVAGIGYWIAQVGDAGFACSANFDALIGHGETSMPSTPAEWLALAHPDERPGLSRLFAMQQGNEPVDPFDFTLRFREASGAWSWFAVKVRQTATAALVATFSNITQQRQTEAALRDSQLRYRALYSTAPLAFILWNREGHITEWNRRAELMFGWPASTVIGKKVHQLLLPPEKHQPFSLAVKSLIQGQGDGQFSGPAIGMNGLSLHCNWYNVALRTPQGNLIGILSLVLDVTQEKLAQDKINKSEKVYRTLVETSPDAILLMTLEGRLQTANQQAMQLFGINELDNAPISLRQLLPSPEAGGPDNDFLDSPDDFTGFIANREIRMQSLDGNPFDASIAFTTIIDSRGQPSGIVLFARDITARLRADRELEQHRRHLEELVSDRTRELETARESLAQIIDNSPVPTFVLDPDHRITHWNQGCANIVGRTAEEMIGTRNQWQAFYSAPRPVMADLVMSGEVDLIENYYEARFRRSNAIPGGYEAEDFFPAFNRWLFITAGPLYDSRGNVIGAIETLQDITERKFAEQALRDAKSLAESAANAKAEFLANMSHEIRTPMNAVIGLAHLLQKTDLSRKQHDYVGRIKGAGEILMRLINDVLDFSKIEAGRMSLENTEFAVDHVLNNVATVVMTRAQEKGLELQYVVDPSVPPKMSGDPLRLTQILVNLLGNAIKFTAHGNVTAFLRAQIAEDGKTVRLEVDVQDTGIGMTLEQQSRLFQAFTQADTSITRTYGGTGLGLTISKRLVELMDGRIWVTSQPNIGSTFSFEIGLGLPENTEAAVSPGLNGLRQRVLVVDDNPLARTVLSRLLEKFGCQTQMTDSGKSALAILEEAGEGAYDYVTIDLNMPEMDGLELAAAIRSMLPSAPKLVLVTASDTHAMEDAGQLTHFDAALNKPLTAAQIGELLAGNPLPVTETLKTSPLAGLHVLLAEDIPTNQLIATEMLASLGITVETADNGRRALELVLERGNRIDLVLMDVQMPEMDGIEATRKIRAALPSRTLPIIAMTAHALDEERERCMASGMNDFITKPIDPDLLFNTLLRWKPDTPVRSLAGDAPMIAQTLPALGADGLPELPGIDKADGLRRMMNKASLYEKVLRDFYKRFASEASLIRAALAANDMATAERHAHSTKGLSGSIGALALQTAAKNLEIAIKSGNTYPEAEMNVYETALTEVIDGIRQGFGLD